MINLAFSFYWILNMSITASFSILCILMLRRIHIIPKRIIYSLYFLVLFRAWIPISKSSRISMMNIVKSFINQQSIPISKNYDLYTMNNMNQAESYNPFLFKSFEIELFFKASSTLWLSIFISLLLYMVISYLRSTAMFNSIKKIEENVYESKAVNSPILVGIIRNKIIIPENFNFINKEFILKHETIHIHRRDNLWRLVALVTLILHWFNPIFWLAFSAFLQDLELSCDELVIKNLTLDGKREYSKLLLSLKQNSISVNSSLGGSQIKKRIIYIMNYKEYSFISILLFVVLAITLAVVLLTNSSN